MNASAGLYLAVPQEKPRTAVFSLRDFEKHVSRCSGYEFEDVITEEIEPGALLIEASPDSVKQRGLRARRWLDRKGVPVGNFSFGADTRSLGVDVELFFVSPALPRDLAQLEAIHDWRARSTKAVCFLQELWIAEIDTVVAKFGRILNQFDHVICGFYYSAEALAERLDVPVSYMPYGVDAELFNPYVENAPRVIDVCAIGNMDAVTYDALWAWSKERADRYYSFTTTGSANFSVSHKQHRRNLAQTLQRSKYFFTYLAKREVTSQRRAQEEFGPRYFEGAAAGAIQLGDPLPSNPAYLEYVDWDGAVIDVPYSSAEIPAKIDALEADPEHVELIRRANVSNCLLRHDHLYRWDEVLRVAGLSETTQAAERRARLARRAASLSDDDVMPTRRDAGRRPLRTRHSRELLPTT